MFFSQKVDIGIKSILISTSKLLLEMFKPAFFCFRLGMCLILFSFTFMYSSLASDSKGDEQEHNRLMLKPYALWEVGSGDFLKFVNIVQSASNCLGAFLNDNSKINDEEFRKNLEGAFSGLLYCYKGTKFPPGQKEFLENSNYMTTIPLQLRDCEVLLAPSYKGKPFFKSEDLWLEGMPSRETISVNRENLEELIEGGKIQNPSLDVRKEIMRGQSMTYNRNHHVPPKIFKLPSNFVGERFLIGGERPEANSSQETYMLNSSPSTYPDIVGDAAESASLIFIPDNKFSLIEFDFIDNTVLLKEKVLTEYTRILKPEGIFLYKTQHNTRDYYRDIKKELQQAKQNLQKLYNEVVGPTVKEDRQWPTEAERFYYSFLAKNKN